MRCYHFGNFYLSSIQQGIQAAHAQMELFNKYTPNDSNGNEVDDEPYQMLFDWSINHKTMICLNGGMNIDIENIFETISRQDNPYPWSIFVESEKALKGLLTNVAIVLPERIYDTAEKLRKRVYVLNGNNVTSTLPQPIDDNGNMLTVHMIPAVVDTLTNFEIELIYVLNSCGLAR